jgi:hypothetical protein
VGGVRILVLGTSPGRRNGNTRLASFCLCVCVSNNSDESLCCSDKWVWPPAQTVTEIEAARFNSSPFSRLGAALNDTSVFGVAEGCGGLPEEMPEGVIGDRSAPTIFGGSHRQACLLRAVISHRYKQKGRYCSSTRAELMSTEPPAARDLPHPPVG